MNKESHWLQVSAAKILEMIRQHQNAKMVFGQNLQDFWNKRGEEGVEN